MSSVVVGAGSQIAADAGAAAVANGGNAIDAAVAASLVLMISEPGVCAPGSGGFITVRGPDETPVTIDANVAMPGAGADPDRFGAFTRQTTMEYGGGVTTIVGYESVGIPGGIAGLGAAWKARGSMPWSEVVAPAVDLARRGAPLSASSHLYLEFSHQDIFGWHPVSRAALHDESGSLYGIGSPIRVEGLVEGLTQLGECGAQDMYRGDLAAVIAEDLDQGGSLVTARDLREYTPIGRPSTPASVGRWNVFTNPPPSIGGVTLAAMLQLASNGSGAFPAVEDLIRSQNDVLRYRRERLDSAENLEAATRALLDDLAEGGGLSWLSAPSTVHASAVGTDGSACSITMSAGYGSGVVAGRSGFWMNNSLGELELNRRGFHGLAVGTRLPSNMAPTIAIRDDGAVLAIGSPGADRITTALQQVLLGVISGRSLQEAVAAPRLHVETDEPLSTVAYEAGINIPDGYQSRRFEVPHMFFGGVAGALMEPGKGLSGGGDQRRTGGIAIA